MIREIGSRSPDMYLKRDTYILHGLALIGIRAVIGVESLRGSPFNVQRSLRVPNFCRSEVDELFRQYREESGQEIQPGISREIYELTRGQPGLACWFGELLTEKYNPGREKTIGMETWKLVRRKAGFTEPNNTVVFLSDAGEEIPAKISHEDDINGIKVVVRAIGI